MPHPVKIAAVFITAETVYSAVLLDVYGKNGKEAKAGCSSSSPLKCESTIPNKMFIVKHCVSYAPLIS